MTATLYLLHFTQPVAHARHYLGYTTLPLDERLRRHRSGDGAVLLRVLVRERGGDFIVAATKTFDTPEAARDAERKGKRRSP